MQLNHTVDPNAAASNSGQYEPLTPGDYEAEIVAVDPKTSKAGNDYLNVQFRTEKGSVWEILNLWNKNPTAVKISNERLDQIGIALGLTKIDDTDQLLARKIKISVDQRTRDDGSVQNTITNFKPSASTPAPTTSTSPATAPWRA